MWRCPHCGTPQAETARCWVCHRSSTACATCRNFRLSVAAQLGYCALDRARQPLQGDEIRACWEASVARPESPELGGAGPAGPQFDGLEERTPVRRLEFIEVEATPVRSRRRAAGADPATRPASVADGTREAPGPAITPTEPRWSLWGDAET